MTFIIGKHFEDNDNRNVSCTMETTCDAESMIYSLVQKVEVS